MADESVTPDEKAPVELTDGQIIARKSADVSAASSDEHRKVFVLPPGPKPTEANGYDHAANKAATVQYLISQGMRPTGEVRLVSIKQHENGVSWVLTYAVPVVPAAKWDYATEAESHIVTESVADDDGHVPNTTDGAGTSGDTSGKTPTPTTGDGATTA